MGHGRGLSSPDPWAVGGSRESDMCLPGSPTGTGLLAAASEVGLRKAGTPGDQVGAPTAPCFLPGPVGS